MSRRPFSLWLSTFSLLTFFAISSNVVAAPKLSSLVVDVAGSAMYPEFHPKVRHYAVRCEPIDNLTITATAKRFRDRVSINGSVPETRTKQVELAELDPDEDIVIEVFGKRHRVGRYTVHCLAEDFPPIEILHPAGPDVSTDLMLVAPRWRHPPGTARKAYIIVLDNNGVPRFHRKIDAYALDFKRHPNGLYTYAYIPLERNELGQRDSTIVVLDEDFNEIDRLKTIGLAQTDSRFLFTEDGNRIFASYNLTTRDMTAFGLSAEQTIADSIIQEVTPEGDVVMQWNSWDHIDYLDCFATGWLPEKASTHLVSMNFTPEGDLIASFKGCAQVLKIDRPTGDVIWRLQGSRSDFTIVGDPFNEFCGAHSVIEPAKDQVLMFDNGNYCAGDREDVFGQFSRVVEYRLDSSSGQAHFVKDHSYNGTYQEFTTQHGSVQLLANDSWFLSWYFVPGINITEVNSSGDVIFAMRMLQEDGTIARTCCAYREATLPSE